MSECEIEKGSVADDAAVACSNCDYSGAMSALKPVTDLLQRISVGETVPAGECPRCGALAHLVKDPARVYIDVDNGIVNEVVANTGDVEVVIRDYDPNYDSEDQIDVDGKLCTVHIGPGYVDAPYVQAKFDLPAIKEKLGYS